jgi:hypothetical protein
MIWVWLEVGWGCQIFSQEKMQHGEFMFCTEGRVAPIM